MIGPVDGFEASAFKIFKREVFVARERPSIYPVYSVFSDRGRGPVVARNVRRLRLERGLTQEELAARIRITRNYVGMIERQENSPTVAMLERIAKALGIEPARLFDEKAAGRKGE